MRLKYPSDEMKMKIEKNQTFNAIQFNNLYKMQQSIKITLIEEINTLRTIWFSKQHNLNFN